MSRRFSLSSLRPGARRPIAAVLPMRVQPRGQATAATPNTAQAVQAQPRRSPDQILGALDQKLDTLLAEQRALRQMIEAAISGDREVEISDADAMPTETSVAEVTESIPEVSEVPIAAPETNAAAEPVPV